jgi:class 3 adenylate cyclase
MVEFEDSMETDLDKAVPLLRTGWLPYLGTGLSMAVCYAKTVAAILLPKIGADWNFNPHLQAILMWALALLAVIAVYRDTKRHGDHYPFYVAGIGLFFIVTTLYLYYHVKFESLGYIVLVAGVLLNQNSILKQLNSRTQQQSLELADWNRTLEQRVAEQVAELDRIGQLKRFLSPKVADLIMAQGDRSLLESHRRHIATLFCDLRGFTSFSESTEPEEVMAILQQYHQELGRLVSQYGGTIDHRAGDGLMVFFNDPLPCDEPVRKAVELAFAAQNAIGEFQQRWAKLGHRLGFGIGIAAGYATLGIVGDESRSDYTAIGNDVNLASRLCDQAKDGEILISQRAYLEIEGLVEVRQLTGLELKGVNRSQEVYAISKPD